MLTRSALRRRSRLALLTVQAWLGLAAFDLTLAIGFARAHERTRQCRVRPRPADATPAVEDVAWAVEEACVWYVKRAACLQRSSVLVALLRTRGIQADLVIGCRPLPFESHAWVEVDGVVVNDRPQYRTFFATLERL
jgi:transglutaminase superfamily protein